LRRDEELEAEKLKLEKRKDEEEKIEIQQDIEMELRRETGGLLLFS
jgi:hypothetical protein